AGPRHRARGPAAEDPADLPPHRPLRRNLQEAHVASQHREVPADQGEAGTRPPTDRRPARSPTRPTPVSRARTGGTAATTERGGTRITELIRPATTNRAPGPCHRPDPASRGGFRSGRSPILGLSRSDGRWHCDKPLAHGPGLTSLGLARSSSRLPRDSAPPATPPAMPDCDRHGARPSAGPRHVGSPPRARTPRAGRWRCAPPTRG